MDRYKKRGWFKEPRRHSLAAKGIKTAKFNNYLQLKDLISRNLPGNVLGNDVVDMRVGESEEEETQTSSRNEMQRRRDVEEELGIGETSESTIDRNINAGRRISRKLDEVIKDTDQVNAAVRMARDGNVSPALQILEENQGDADLNTTQVNALQSAIGEAAIRQANAGIDVSEEVKTALDPTQRSQVENIEKARARESEGPIKQALREAGRAGVVGAVDRATIGVEETAKAGFEGIGEAFEGTQVQAGDFPGILENIESVENGAFTDANVFTESDNGISFGPSSMETPRLGAAFDQLGPGGNPALSGQRNPALGGDTNVIFGAQDEGETFSERVSREIDNLQNAKFDLSDVDISAFDKGERAFEKGDREGMIEAISELQSQESKIKDRWDLLSQTHSMLKSNENRQSLFEEEGSTNIFFGGKGGARELTDQTEKLADVRGELIKANNKVFSRRKALEFDLQRMDAAVPPERDVPDNIQPFDARSDKFDVREFIRSTPNVATDENNFGGLFS